MHYSSWKQTVRCLHLPKLSCERDISLKEDILHSTTSDKPEQDKGQGRTSQSLAIVAIKMLRLKKIPGTHRSNWNQSGSEEKEERTFHGPSHIFIWWFWLPSWVCGALDSWRTSGRILTLLFSLLGLSPSFYISFFHLYSLEGLSFILLSLKTMEFFLNFTSPCKKPVYL